MKLLKYHSVAIAKFIEAFLVNGYYPADELEEVLVAEVMGFATYHKLWAMDTLRYAPACRDLSYKQTARLDLTEDEACAILYMCDECYLDEDFDGPLVPDATVNYIHANFVKKEEE